MRWALAFLAFTGCACHHARWAYVQPAAEPASPMTAQPINLGQGVKGSDGSYGWRARAANVDESYNHAVALAEMHGCAMASRDGEARADCGGVHIVVRRDRDHLYRLCELDVARETCAETWAAISR